MKTAGNLGILYVHVRLSCLGLAAIVINCRLKTAWCHYLDGRKLSFEKV